LGYQCFFFILYGFDDFGVEELRAEVWWEYFEIHRGIVVYFALGIFSVKDDVMNSLIDKEFLPLSQPYHEFMARCASECTDGGTHRR
jgi:hypothetical protein